MNYKIAKTMLALCIFYLLGFYVLKLFFPELLLQAITSETVLRLGEFINSSKVIETIFQCVTIYATLYLFVCASTGRFAFNGLCFVFILVGTILTEVIALCLPQFYTHASISIMFILALICGGKLLNATISFTLHGFLSQLLLSIRGFETVLTKINAISGLLLTTEAFVWLVVLTIIFNIKEKENG